MQLENGGITLKELSEQVSKINAMLDVIKNLEIEDGQASQARVCRFLLNYAKLNGIGYFSKEKIA